MQPTAAMNPASVSELPADLQVGGRVVLHVLYDTPVMQSASAIVCDQLRVSFCADLELHTVWSHFQHLADRHYSREAAEVAAQADVVILATAACDSLPGEVTGWLGSWICQKQKGDAVLCGLFQLPPERKHSMPPVARLLKAAAAITGREWLAGIVHREAAHPVAPLHRRASLFANGFFFHTPACHGING